VEVVNGSTLVSFELFGEPIEVTDALLRVSGGIAAFADAYYAIAVLTDATYREEFLDDLTDDMRSIFTARGVPPDAGRGAADAVKGIAGPTPSPLVDKGQVLLDT
jgi:hypothetical protein